MHSAGHEADTGTSRRAFLGRAAAGGATLAVAGTTGTGVAQAAGRRKPAKPYRETARIDVHGHYLAPAYRAALAAQGITTAIGGIPLPSWTPELALRFMDAEGIAVQMLSISDPGVAFLADDAAAAALARTCNDYAASVVAAHPKRFGAFAVVPLRDVAAATAEAVRALDQLELDGVGLLSSADGAYLGDPRFEPLLAALDARGAWVFVHPTAIGDDDKPSFSIPDFVAEYPFDTTRTIISLLFNDAFARYPRIRWHFAHGGGTVPMLRSRLTVLAGNAKQFGAIIGLPPRSAALNAKSANKALAGCHYDTALIADPPELAAVSSMASTDRLLFGSDWPFAWRYYGPAQNEYPKKVNDPQPVLSDAFSADVRHDIDRRNARRQFKRLASAVPKG